MDHFTFALMIYVAINFAILCYTVATEGMKVRHIRYVPLMLALALPVLISCAAYDHGKSLGEVDLIRPFFKQKRSKKRK